MRSTCLCVTISLACMAAAGCSTVQGWRALFDGKTLDGWVVKCKPQDVNRAFWTVDQGSILADSLTASGHDYVWLCSDREYSDFVLRLKSAADAPRELECLATP